MNSIKHDIVSASELDGHTDLFGWKYHNGGSNGLVTLYMEDDENWFPKMTFDIFWLSNLVKASGMAYDSIKEKLNED